MSVREHAHVECHVHEVDCPEALSTVERVASGVDEHEDHLLTDNEGQERCQQAAAHHLLVVEVAAAGTCRAGLPQLHAVVQAL